MSEQAQVVQKFEREERYIVIKRSHISEEDDEQALRDFLQDYQIQTVECVVVESDWPEYETVWQMIEDRVTGKALVAKLGGAVVPDGWQQAAEWLRNNYQDHANIAALCDAMLAVAPQPVEVAEEDRIDCPSCKGSEIIGEKRGIKCLTCNGRGTVAVASTTGNHFDAVSQRGVAGEAGMSRTNAQVHGCAFEGWQCFHCGEILTTVGEAQEHFGFTQTSDPACRIKLGAERGLLAALRKAEKSAADAWLIIHNESSEAAKAVSQMQSRHADQFRVAEELGYERGLRDATAPKAPEAVPLSEIGWLVEDSRNNGLIKYRTMDQEGIHWTEDVNKAIRFARREDAEMFADGDEDAWHIAEHIWG